MANTYQMPIKYKSQLYDNNQHTASVEGIGRGDALHLLVTLNQAVEKTRAPVKAKPEQAAVLSENNAQPESVQSLDVIIPSQFQGYWCSVDSCKV